MEEEEEEEEEEEVEEEEEAGAAEVVGALMHSASSFSSIVMLNLNKFTLLSYSLRIDSLFANLNFIVSGFLICRAVDEEAAALALALALVAVAASLPPSLAVFALQFTLWRCKERMQLNIVEQIKHFLIASGHFVQLFLCLRTAAAVPCILQYAHNAVRCAPFPCISYWCAANDPSELNFT